MSKTWLIVVALLLTALPTVAAAAQFPPEHKSKNAQKILDVLNSLGINNPQIKEFVDKVNTHVSDGYYNFTEGKAPGGKYVLRYELGSKISSRKLELMYTPKESHIQCIGGTNRLLMNYHLDFN